MDDDLDVSKGHQNKVSGEEKYREEESEREVDDFADPLVEALKSLLVFDACVARV